jgi:hypothetical protein
LFFLQIFFAGIECFGHSFAHVAHLWFMIRTQRACHDKQACYQLRHLYPASYYRQKHLPFTHTNRKT